MEIKEYTSKWDNKIEGATANDFYKAIEEAAEGGDVNRVKEASLAVMEVCRTFFDEEEEEYIINEIESIIEDINESTTDPEEVDKILNEIYDFCDGYSILIDVKEENPEAEVFVDDTKDTGVKEKPEDSIEQIEVTEINPEEE